VTGGAYYHFKEFSARPAQAEEVSYSESGGPAIRVEVIRPHPGGLERVSTQPGTVRPYESVDLFAEVSGYLKKQTVDIGDRVKKGQVLAEIDVPELEKQVEKWAASVQQAQARVQVMEASKKRAEAEWEAAKAQIPQSEAALAAAQAMSRFRQKSLRRIEDLFRQASVDERLVDEKEDQRDAALATERAAAEGVVSAKCQEVAARAKIDQAKADVADAQAKVLVAQAELDQARVMVGFARITSPFDGVITHREMFPGAFVRSAKEGGLTPLLSVDRTDKVRVVVQVPDRDVPYTDPNDPATVEIDALPGQVFHGAVSRIASAEDQQSRLMRVEIDLPNPEGRLRDGMYGRVTITLEKGAPDLLTVPSSCLVNKTDKGEGTVYVVRDSKAHLVPVRVGMDNGVDTEVLKGLKPGEEVINNPPSGIEDGVPVTVAVVEGTPVSAEPNKNGTRMNAD
jgi:RND family efflux transporter MFP subunit